MPTLKLTVEEACEIIHGDHEEAIEVEKTIVDKQRWTITKRMIFILNGRFYSLKYRVPATENQDADPFGCVSHVNAVEVHQVEKLVKVWESVT